MRQLTLYPELTAIDTYRDIAVVRAPLTPAEWAQWRPHVLQAQKLPDGVHWALRLRAGTSVKATEPSHGSFSLSNQANPRKWIDIR